MLKARVLLTGGGTGGHIYPLIPVIRELQKRGAEIAFIGPEEFPLQVLREEKIEVFSIMRAGKLRRYFSLATIGDTIKLPFAILQARGAIKKFRPHVLLGKGGYGTIAPVIAARMAKVPVVLHESDVIPGLANRKLARFADLILLGFTEAAAYFKDVRTEVVGNPVRNELRGMSKSEARKLLNFDPQRKTIFVIGGSLGSLFINKLVKQALPELLKRYAVILNVGKENMNYMKEINVNNALVVPFMGEKDLAAAFALADVVVSRPGASVMFEIALTGKPSILIPIAASTGGHQEANARAYEEAEATVVLTEDKVTPQTFTYAIESILNNYEVSAHMSTRARKFATPDAAEKIADILFTYAK